MHRCISIVFAFVAISLCFPSFAGERGVVVNEIMPANVSFLFDYSYNYGAWVELYNASDEKIDLAGYSLTDDADKECKFVIPSSVGVIEPRSFKIIFFDNNDLDSRQADFKLDCDGATLYLFSPEGGLLSSVEYGYSYPNLSYARKNDGVGSWATCITPTPGRSNDGSAFSVERLAAPEASVAAGVYKRGFVLKLTAPVGVTVRYTTDGSEPCENSKIWSGYMGVSSTTILRARSYKKGCIPSEIFTATYIIEKEREFDLPVISIVTDPGNFFNDTIGIYCTGTNGKPGNSVSYPANWNMDWKRPVNVEIFNGKYDDYFSQQCEASIGGGWSRAYAMKSIELNAEKKYEGMNFFATRFFLQKPYYRFKSINLRNSGNDFHDTMFSDAMQQSFYAGVVDVDYQAYQPAVHFINGEYYGIINIRERSNQHYVNSNWGYDKENIDLIEQHDRVAFNGDMFALNRLLALVGGLSVNPTAYEKVLPYIDIDEYINYIVIESFSANTDWMGNNVKFYRSRDNGRFRWILFDTDFGFKEVDRNMFTTYLNDKYAYTGEIFNGLSHCKQFRQKFMDHALAIIGGAMRYERTSVIIDSIKSLISNEISYHGKRWGKNYNIEEKAAGFKNFAKNRVAKYVKHMGDYFSMGTPLKVKIVPEVKSALFLNGVQVPTGLFDGYLYARSKYNVSVEVPVGYKLKHWDIIINNEKTASAGKEYKQARKPDIYSTVYEFLPISGEYTLIPRFEKLDTLHGYLPPAVRINELGANKELVYNDRFEKSDWVELYNVTDTVFDIAGLYISNSEDNLRLYRIPADQSDATRIAPYGHVVLWADEESGNSDIHLPFKLPSKGGSIILSAYAEDDSTLLWRDEIVYTPHGDDRTFGRFPDGGNKLYELYRPTPGNTNLGNSNNLYVALDTVTGYHIKDAITSVSNVIEDAEILSVEYYSSNGTLVGGSYDELPTGVYICRTRYTNGKTITCKQYKK